MFKPIGSDYTTIGFYTGKITVGVGLLMIVPALTACLFGEWPVVLDFLIGLSLCIIVGLGLQLFTSAQKEINWTLGMVIASVSWFIATCLGAVPSWLSGQYGSYLDACFDVMSGYTTTGLYLIQNLNHTSNGLNMWRHLLSYVGGQGIIVVALTFAMKGFAGTYTLYVGEGKDERLLPNVIHTARVIWLISLAYMSVGTVILTVLARFAGMGWIRGFFHSLWLFMGAWSTGGFAPMSQNLMYYHSAIIETVTLVIFVAGSMNFALHFTIWHVDYREIFRNLEIISFTCTVLITSAFVLFGLERLGVYPTLWASWRRGFYHLASAHTTTGNMTIYSSTWLGEWGFLSYLGLIIAMTIGGSACSTAGGFKNLRIGVIFTGLVENIRRLISPESSVLVQKFHHIRDTVLTDEYIRMVMLIVLSYIGLYLLSTFVAVSEGYPFMEAMFEGVSAASNTGLSCGLTLPAMPALIKVVYIFAMWAGRLEFMALFALFGFIGSIIGGVR
ncbi:MAG: TrkH family potassium uptake protein [bacterium]